MLGNSCFLYCVDNMYTTIPIKTYATFVNGLHITKLENNGFCISIPICYPAGLIFTKLELVSSSIDHKFILPAGINEPVINAT